MFSLLILYNLLQFLCVEQVIQPAGWLSIE